MPTTKEPAFTHSLKKFKQWVSQIKVPEGFTLIGPEKDANAYWWKDKPEDFGNAHWVLSLISESIKIKLNFVMKTPKDIFKFEKEDGMTAFAICGHVDFKADENWFSFDSRGISDSFYAHDGDDPNELIQKQITRCKEAIERKKNQFKIPGFPISIYLTEEKRQEIIKKLKSGEDYLFTPGGMGTAYRCYLGSKKNRYDIILSQEVSDFFGVKQIHASQLDWD